MKKILFVFIIVLLLPIYVFAHGPMMNFVDVETGPQTMQYIEENTLGSDTHEEMEQLMTKMMSGTMTQEEVVKVTELMGQYPGPYGMMMVRLSSPQVNQLDGNGSGWNMMSGWNSMMGWGLIWFWIFMFSWLVWIAVGILLVVWLIRKLLNFK